MSFVDEPVADTVNALDVVARAELAPKVLDVRVDDAIERLGILEQLRAGEDASRVPGQDRKSTRLNSSHSSISYAVFCVKKKISVDLARLALDSFLTFVGVPAARRLVQAFGKLPADDVVLFLLDGLRTVVVVFFVLLVFA